jgi:hypothetical protein
VREGASVGATGAKTFKYLYDFGDGWEHTIKIERIVEAEPGASYPRLLEASGRCPPEDVGGPSGIRKTQTCCSGLETIRLSR